MLNEERVKLMTQMASYENKEGQKDFKISSYYRKDYVGLNILITNIWITVGYIMVLAAIAILNMETLFKNLKFSTLIVLGIAVVTLYIILMIVYGVIASNMYYTKHNKAKQRVKKFYRDLSHLNRMYKKEKL